MASGDVRRYEACAQSTTTFGRVLCSMRDQHMVVDGPVQNGCPGEAATPGELFLGSVACCGVELTQVIARDQRLPLNSVRVAVSGTLDRSKPVRPDLTLFSAVRLDFHLKGVTEEQGARLIETFKGR